MNYDELVKRLRERCVFLFPHHGESRSYDADLMHQAADAIEELSREYDSVSKSFCESVELVRKIQPKAPRWISVKARFPEEQKDVLVYLKRGGCAVDYFIPSRWGYKDVTHWMPLPTPPKEETE